MAQTDLKFDVKATDSASRTFLKLAAAVEALSKKLDALDGKKVTVTVTVKVNDKDLDRLRQKLAGLRDRVVKVSARADDKGFDALRQKLAGLRDRTLRVKVKVDDKDLDKLRQKLGALRDRTVRVRVTETGSSRASSGKVGADTRDADRDIARVNRELDKIDGRKVKAKVEVDVDGDGVRSAAFAFAAARDAGAEADQAAKRLAASLREVDRSSASASRSVRTAASAFSEARDAANVAALAAQRAKGFTGIAPSLLSTAGAFSRVSQAVSNAGQAVVRVLARTSSSAVAAAKSLNSSAQSLNNVSRSGTAAAKSLNSSAQSLNNASRSGTATSKSLNSSAQSLNNVGTSARTTSRSVSSLDNAFVRTTRAVGEFGQGITQGVSGLAGVRTAAQAALGVTGVFLRLATFATAGAVAGAGLAAAYGAVSTGLAALPGVASLVVAPLAAVSLGMDGIKKAAEVLTPQFEAMKAAVSATFEEGLAPAMQNIAKIIPTVQTGMVGIAKSMSTAATEVTEFLAQSENIGKLEGIFTNVGKAITGMTPGVKSTVGALLDLANQPALFEGMTHAVNDFGAAFKTSVSDLIKDGTLQQAFTGLGDVVGSLGKGLVGLVENGIELFAGAAPGVAEGLDGITEFFGKFDWESLGTSVGGVFEGIGKALAGVSPETIDAIEASFGGLAEVFQSPGFAAGLQGFIGALPTLVTGFGSFIEALGPLGETLGVLTAPGGLFGVGGLFGPTQEQFDAYKAAAARTKELRKLGQELVAGEGTAWTKLKTDFVDFAAGAAENLISDFSGFFGEGKTVEVPITVKPVVSAATGSVAQGVGALQQAIRGLISQGQQQIDVPVQVKPTIEVALGGIAQGVGALQQAIRGLIGGTASVEAKVQVKPTIELALGGIAQGVAAIQQGIRGLIGKGITVEAPVQVKPVIEIALGGVGQGVGILQQAIRGLIGKSQTYPVPVPLQPVPEWGPMPGLEPPPTAPPPLREVPVPLKPAPEWGPMPGLEPPPGTPPPPQQVPVPLTPNPEWGPMPGLDPPSVDRPAAVTVPVPINPQPQVAPMPAPQIPSPPPQNVPVQVNWQAQVGPPPTPPAPSIAAVSTGQTVNVTQQTNVTPPPTPPAPHIPAVHTTQTVYVRQITITQASRGAIAGAEAGLGGFTSQDRQFAVAAARRRPGLAGGGVIPFAGGGPVRFPSGGVLPGYAPGRDTINAVLSRGEAVLVPELVRQIGAGNIMAANYEASRRRPAALPMAAGGPVSLPPIRSASRQGTPDLLKEVRGLRRDLAGFTEATGARRSPVAITVNDQSGNPVETARATQLALRMASI